MVDIILNILIAFFLISGLFFYVVGTVGLIRMPDVFCRMHATTKADTLGAGLIFTGLMIWQGFSFVSLNIFIILVFIWLTTPTAAHAIAKSEYLAMKKKEEEAN
jgi:multicomponent Na+:H+ antiporter subunit G